MAQAQWDISQGVLTDIADAPKAIQELAAAIQGKSPAEVRAAIIARFGPAQRDIGSGLSIEQWDTSQGVLTLNAGMGPTFFDPQEKKLFRLLRTTNLVHVNLLQSYDMATLHDPADNGMSYGLGTLRFDADMTYRFEDSGSTAISVGRRPKISSCATQRARSPFDMPLRFRPTPLLEKVTKAPSSQTSRSPLRTGKRRRHLLSPVPGGYGDFVLGDKALPLSWTRGGKTLAMSVAAQNRIGGAKRRRASPPTLRRRPRRSSCRALPRSAHALR